MVNARQGRGQQMRNDLAVGLASHQHTLGGEFFAQLGEVLDDAVMDDRHPAIGAGVGWAFRSLGAPWWPTWWADADGATGIGSEPSKVSRLTSLPAFLRM